MRVVCPYEPAVHPLARSAMDKHIATVEYHRVGPGADAYWRLLCEVWSDQVTFVIVEHDVEVHGGVFPALAHCPRPWCVFPYPCTRLPEHLVEDDINAYMALGCTRFRRSLMLKHPDLMGTLGLGEGTPRHMVEMARNWRGLDSHVGSALMRLGYQPHTHWPAVKHHHEYPAGCACGEVLSHDPAKVSVA